MRKKKILTTVLIIIAVLSVCTGVGIFLFGKSLHVKNNNPTESHKEGDVTRFEWLKMLCEQFGMTEYENETPYFSDVDENNANFLYVQSAAEWEVIDTASNFDGNKYATGEFIGITAMKTIGENKIQICLDQEIEISDDDYLRLAADNHLVNEEQQTKGFTKEECEDILGKLRELYFGTYSPNNISRVEYQDGVVELPPEVILQRNEDDSEITVNADTLASVSQGRILVFEQADSGLKQAMRVENIEESGLLSLSPVQPEDVIESLVVSDVREITADDIFRYYGVSNNGYMAHPNTYETNFLSTGYSAIPMAKMESKGFKIGLSTDMGVKNNILNIEVTDNTTGLSYEVNQVEIDEESYYNGEFDIDKIAVTSQVKFKGISGVKYADIALDSHMEVGWGFHFERSKKAAEKLLLCETPIPLGNGVVGVKIQLYLVISAEGDISLEAEVPVQFAVRYEKGKGIRNYKHDLALDEPAIECNLEIDGKLRLEPTLIILSAFNIIDVEADIGVTAKANVKDHLEQGTCTDISVHFPIVTISVCGDDDNVSLVNALGISAEWEIIKDENAPFRFGLHYETYPDGTSKFVDDCTYIEKEPTEEPEFSKEPADLQGEETDQSPEPNDNEGGINIGEVNLNHTYRTKYADHIAADADTLAFDYPDNWEVISEEVSDYGIGILENVILSNARGVTVKYYYMTTDYFPQSIHISLKTEALKVADSQFIPSYPVGTDTDYSSVLGDFMVAKLETVGKGEEYYNGEYNDEESYKKASEYRPVSLFSYAVVPESAAGVHEYWDPDGLMQEFSFEYNGYYAFIAEAPEGQFTSEEEQEVIAILSSFRLAN